MTRTRRTTLLLDEQLLERAVREFEVRTYSAAVNLALSEALRLRESAGLETFFGSDLWEGDLGAMRDDRIGQGKRKGR